MNPFPALDARLSLIYDLYDPCDLAADIGTDHAYLPAALLQRGRCQKMILTDVSASALANARNEMVRSRLLSRCDLRLGNGLSPLREACGMISVTGMGGRTIRQILLDGQDHLLGASLLLSAHTDWPLIRQTLMDIGYHADREEPCLSGGRFYLVVRASVCGRCPMISARSSLFRCSRRWMARICPWHSGCSGRFGRLTHQQISPLLHQSRRCLR